MNNTLLLLLLILGLLLLVALIITISIHRSYETIKDMTRETYGTDSIEEAMLMEDAWGDDKAKPDSLPSTEESPSSSADLSNSHPS